MHNTEAANNLNILRQEINNAYRRCEHECIAQLLQQPIYSTEELSKIQEHARDLTNNARDAHNKNNILQTLLQQYDLSTEQGIALMCLAEALLRIPDQKTRDLLISDKISTVNWIKNSNKHNSFFANAASWSLLIAGKIFSPVQHKEQDFITILKQALVKPGIIVLRPFIKQAIKIIGSQFVKGETIEEALKDNQSGYCFSFDMLGEAARTAKAAQQYFAAYQHAINIIGNSSQSHNTDLTQNASISIKLSALHPRYEYSQKNRILTELVPELIKLVCLAQKYNIGVTIDAEEADRLELSLDVFTEVFNSPALQSWSGLGIAVQAYQKRAPYVINWLKELAHHAQKRIMVRLVKGAYWDYEIKQTQILGLSDYPVFTRKQATDLSYLVCAHTLLHNCKYFYPQFATHNIYSISAVLVMASSIAQQEGFEFQCLYGMGNPMYDQIVGHTQYEIPVRVYAPVGSHESLVGYLIRRLLENGANNSFVRKLANQETNIEDMLVDPAVHLSNHLNKSHPYIKIPREMYPDRSNSLGTDLSDPAVLNNLQTELVNTAQDTWVSNPIINGHDIKGNVYYTSVSPVNITDNLGQVYLPNPEDVEHCLAQAQQGTKLWAATHYLIRAEMLENVATLLQEHKFELVGLLVRESGKTITDALGELREAIDYCYYYAAQAKQKLAPQQLVGPTGESNVLTLNPRGVIVCISPCNFPLAIFTGQIVAALVTGNVVIAKPAEQTPIIATQVVKLLYQAGIPSYALHLLPGQGSIIGSHLVQDQRVAGVMFTGSTRAAFTINRDLANRPGPIIPLIAETGGQNTMIVDASALCEQVVVDIIQSAFNSSGQRCSALRILFVQEDISEKLMIMLSESMAELKIGNPALISTDIGPIIDKDSLQRLTDYMQQVQQVHGAKILYQTEIPQDISGYYFGPCAIVLNNLSAENLELLKGEIFGPILHIIPYAAQDLDKVLDYIGELSYGLTLGIQSHITSTIEYIKQKTTVGNTYINRNIIGAVVGVQPFGGEGLSGTGPKAGGPNYLLRLCIERTVTTNTTAVGGNVNLINLAEDDNAFG